MSVRCNNARYRTVPVQNTELYRIHIYTVFCTKLRIIQYIIRVGSTYRINRIMHYITMPQTVRSCCVLIAASAKKEISDRFVWAFSHKGLSKILGRSVFFGACLAYFFMI
jgi:hypothetical protein